MKNLAFLLLIFAFKSYAQEATYAEKLGFSKGSKVLILHVDDVGMSYDSNLGAIKAMEKGVATSLSMMMPCAWIPGFFEYLKLHPETDAGLHLTLTSEWNAYRWGPLMGKPAVPGLVDGQGAMWSSVEGSVKHASADEIEKEIMAQLDRSRTMGWEPTHLDSHMGTLFAKKEFLERYLKIGMQEKIPVMFPGGHNSMIMETAGSTGLTKEITTVIGKQLWAAGLPVLDDLHNVSYGWGCPPAKINCTDAQLLGYKTKQYIKSIDALKPGLTMVIMHCSWPSEIFKHITDSGTIRKGDAMTMMDPTFKAYLKKNNIILTTWREVKKRRDALEKK
jgi:chitin disaccharide deacetylase